MSNNAPPIPAAGNITGGSIPVFATIAAPILPLADLVKVSLFLQQCEQYELEIQTKQAIVPIFNPLPYATSIDHTFLQSHFYMGKCDDIVPDANAVWYLSNEHIQAYTKSLISYPDTGASDSTTIALALTGFFMPTKILNAEDRIIT